MNSRGKDVRGQLTLHVSQFQKSGSLAVESMMIDLSMHHHTFIKSKQNERNLQKPQTIIPLNEASEVQASWATPQPSNCF